MILKLYSVRNIKRDFYNPPFVLEDEKFLRQVILRAMIDAKFVAQELKDFEVHYLGDFDNTSGFLNYNKESALVLECSDLLGDFLDACNFELPPDQDSEVNGDA